MPIHTGVVKGIGSGNFEGDNASFMYVRREYIDIGGEHLRCDCPSTWMTPC